MAHPRLLQRPTAVKRHRQLIASRQDCCFSHQTLKIPVWPENVHNGIDAKINSNENILSMPIFCFITSAEAAGVQREFVSLGTCISMKEIGLTSSG